MENKTMENHRTDIILENYTKFRNYLTRRLSDPVLAEDLLQQSLIKAMRSSSDILEERSVLAWFYTILRNTVTDHFRARLSEEKALRTLPQVEAIVFPDVEGEICECMKSLLPSLPQNYAEVIERIDFEGKDPASVAVDLGISRSNVDVRLFRARKALKKALESMCGACTEHACLQCSCKG